MATKAKGLTIIGIGAICAAVLSILAFTGKAQDIASNMVIQNRKPYFREDHKPLCDSMDSLKMVMKEKDLKDSIIKNRVDLTYYILKQMATSDQKTRAVNEMNEDKQTGILR